MLEWSRNGYPTFFWDEVLGGGIFSYSEILSMLRILGVFACSASPNITSAWHYLGKVRFFPFPPLPLTSYLTIKSDCFSCSVRNKTGVFTHATSIQHCSGDYSLCNKARKRNKRYLDWKRSEIVFVRIHDCSCRKFYWVYRKSF